MKPERMLLGSLFSGLGGFDLAAKRLGFEIAWQSEIDKHCCRILQREFPGVENLGDVRTINTSRVKGVDVITGGFPCTDVSVAGKRAGLAGKQSGLWTEFHRIITDLTPRWVLAENVPGLISSWTPIESTKCSVSASRYEVEERSDFERVILDLVELGYCVAWRCLDAQYFGLAQRRKRVFIAASLGNGNCVNVLLEPESLCEYIETSGKKRTDIARCLANGTGSSGYRFDPNEETLIADTLQANSHGGFRQEPGAGLINNHQGVRRLTELEAERLQGFPDYYTKYGSDGKEIPPSARYKALGNAVAAPVVEWILRRLKAADTCKHEPKIH